MLFRSLVSSWFKLFSLLFFRLFHIFAALSRSSIASFLARIKPFPRIKKLPHAGLVAIHLVLLADPLRTRTAIFEAPDDRTIFFVALDFEEVEVYLRNQVGNFAARVDQTSAESVVAVAMTSGIRRRIVKAMLPAITGNGGGTVIVRPTTAVGFFLISQIGEVLRP